jgi:hypothetical protein
MEGRERLGSKVGGWVLGSCIAVHVPYGVDTRSSPRGGAYRGFWLEREGWRYRDGGEVTRRESLLD